MMARYIYGKRKIEPRPCFGILRVLSKITLGLSSGFFFFFQGRSNVNFVDKRLRTVHQQNKTTVTNLYGTNVVILVFLSKYLLLVVPRNTDIE